jgi:hypothetical protein
VISEGLALTVSYKVFRLDEITAQLNELGESASKFFTQEVCKNLLAGVLSPKFNKNGIESVFLKSTLEMIAKIVVVIGLMTISYKCVQ